MTSQRTGRPTLRTVADAAGVSTATVSYVMRGRTDGINPETAERVRSAADALGYRPNRSAQTMRTGRSNIVLLCLDMLRDPWSQTLAEETARVADAAGMTALIQADGRWWETIDRVQPDVAFIDTPDLHEHPERLIRPLVAHGHRLVVLSSEMRADGIHVIDSPSYDGATSVMAHLLAQTDDITMLTTERTLSYLDDGVPYRAHAYTEAVAAGRIRRPQIASFDGSVDGAYNAALDVLNAPDRPRAIFTTADYIGIEALRAARSIGLRVPDDVLVTGLGDTTAAASTVPPLTTAGPPKAARRIAEMIVRAATEDIGSGAHTVFAWETVIRPSSGGQAV